jgi:hypothetical protein
MGGGGGLFSSISYPTTTVSNKHEAQVIRLQLWAYEFADSWDLLFGLGFYIILGPSVEIIGAETIAKNDENLLNRCTGQGFV